VHVEWCSLNVVRPIGYRCGFDSPR